MSQKPSFRSTKQRWLLFCFLALLVLVFNFPLVHAQDSIPTWTNKSGKTIAAEFISLDGDTLEIQKEGKRFKIALGSLAPSSRTQALELAKKATTTLPELKFFPSQESLALEYLGFASLGENNTLIAKEPRFDLNVEAMEKSVVVSKKVDGEDVIQVESRPVKMLWGPLIGHSVTTVPVEKCHCFYVDGTPVEDLTDYFSKQPKTVFICPDRRDTQSEAKKEAIFYLNRYLHPYYRTILRKDFAILVLPSKVGDAWVASEFEALPSAKTNSK